VCHRFLAVTALAGAPPSQDAFWRLSQINKASIVMLVETGLVLRAGIQQVTADKGRPGAKCFGDYSESEALLVKVAGPEALTPKWRRLVGARR